MGQPKVSHRCVTGFSWISDETLFVGDKQMILKPLYLSPCVNKL